MSTTFLPCDSAPHRPANTFEPWTARPFTVVHFERFPLSKPSVKMVVVELAGLLAFERFPAASTALIVYVYAVPPVRPVSVELVTLPSDAIAVAPPLR